MKKLLFLISYGSASLRQVPSRTSGICIVLRFIILRTCLIRFMMQVRTTLNFLPSGSYAWTAEKYEAKLKNLAKVLSEVSRDRVPEGPAVIGVAEAENNSGIDGFGKPAGYIQL